MKWLVFSCHSLIKYFIQKYEIIISLDKTILYYPCEIQNNLLVKCLVSLNEVDINLIYRENTAQKLQ